MRDPGPNRVLQGVDQAAQRGSGQHVKLTRLQVGPAGRTPGGAAHALDGIPRHRGLVKGADGPARAQKIF
ncbi:hypothetical protein GCM10016455_18930 [Aliiroseovarius zhejiangensis]|uniref:Uncharacterized protein n=1 Tax=Aliiroseovarius zhejiangensis TaxID=1632025 RepID=A0ABQ3IZ76_9RHOB|nr:hypothetical protein GCM10016455_18930 [Aliiroseovarius zhejiangensis]